MGYAEEHRLPLELNPSFAVFKNVDHRDPMLHRKSRIIGRLNH